MTQSPIMIAASKLSKSPSNVRKSSDPVADAQLEANIAVRGVIQNLIGLPVARKKGHYRITAGGRRLDAVHRLIEKGCLSPDYAVPILVVGDVNDAIEISLSENFFKLSMNPADACRAFQDIIETEKKTPSDVAQRFGLTERFVLGRLRLAGLAEPIFEALSRGDISLDVAQAYASTGDTVRQASIFEQLSSAYYKPSVSEIRRLLAQGAYKANDPKALLVGREAYIEAGGRFDADLFTDDENERWIDGELLEQLAQEKLQAAAEALKDRHGYAEVRSLLSSHVPYAQTFGLRPISGDAVPLTHEQQERQTVIETELAEIEQAAEQADGYSEEQSERIEALEEELGELLDRPTVVSEEDKAIALAYVVIGDDGLPVLHEQLYHAPQDHDDEIVEDDDESGGDQDHIIAGSEKPALNRRLVEELAIMKTQVVAVQVATHSAFAADLGAFLLAEMALQFSSYLLPTVLRADLSPATITNPDGGTRAEDAWVELDAALERSWTEADSIEARYDAFCALPDEARSAWNAWSIARTLQPAPTSGRSKAFFDHLGRKLEIDMAASWRPTARSYFDRLRKAEILDLMAEIGGPELKSRYASAKKHDLAATAEKLFAGDLIIDAQMRERLLAWVPDMMGFGERAQPAPESIISCEEELVEEPIEDALPQAA